VKQFLITVAGVLVGLVLFLVLTPVLLISMIVGSVDKAPVQPAHMVLALDLRVPMTDQRAQGPFAFAAEPGLLDVLTRIEAASADPKVEGIFVRANTAGMAPAQAEEIRAALAGFREAGKFVVAHLQNDGVRMSMPGYMAVADADEVWLQESSEFQPMGLSAEVTFLAGTLQRYHMAAQFEAREEYKTFANTLTQRGFTPAHREELTVMMSGLYETMLANIAADRGITPQAARAAIVATPYTGARAVELKLVDSLGRPEDAERAALARVEESGLVEFHEYHPPAVHGDDVIAVVQGEGGIYSGVAEDSFFGGEQMMLSDNIARALRDAAEDEDVDAIVFRVSSPGGSVVASDQILAALRAAQASGKKVVVSMGEVAASGGYYVSAYADEIVASPSTITGSIGVVGGKLIIGPAIDHYLSTNTETITMGSPMVEMFTAERGFNPAERAAFAGFIDRAYQDFIGLVAEGRGLTREQAHAAAHGRVWTGQQALALKLVDHLGGFEVAVARARARRHRGRRARRIAHVPGGRKSVRGAGALVRRFRRRGPIAGPPQRRALRSAPATRARGAARGRRQRAGGKRAGGSALSRI
jgi:protease IV